MIRLTRINHLPLVLNSDLIEHVEITPDTVIAMTSGQKYMVLESADEVIERVIDFRRTIANLPVKASTICQNLEPASEERS
jgi:flagellar protein FlbD